MGYINLVYMIGFMRGIWQQLAGAETSSFKPVLEGFLS